MHFEGYGNEQRGWRPGVIFQNNIGNAHSPNVIALPLTSSLKKLDMPTHVLVRAEQAGLKCDSVVLCENPRCMSKENIGKYLTTLPDEIMRDIAIANLAATSAISFLDLNSLVNVWQQAVRMNSAA